MNARLGAVVMAAVMAVLANACGSDPSASTSLTSPTNPGGGLTPPPGISGPTAVSDPGGEWNLTGPAGFPNGGCISLSDISGTELDWTVQATPGHTHRILMEGIVTRGPAVDCSTFSGGDSPRSLTITGGGWTFLIGESGTRTIAWPTEECAEDGGHFQIDVQIERDVPSVGAGDKESRELIVNCGFYRRP